jgi:hypothetical protein
MGVVDSNMVVEHDSRRKLFPMQDARQRRVERQVRTCGG